MTGYYFLLPGVLNSQRAMFIPHIKTVFNYLRFNHLYYWGSHKGRIKKKKKIEYW